MRVCVCVCVPSVIPTLLFLPSCHSNHHPYACVCVCLVNVKSMQRQAETALSTPRSCTLPLSSELYGDQTKLKTHITHNPLLASMPDPTPHRPSIIIHSLRLFMASVMWNKLRTHRMTRCSLRAISDRAPL